MAPPWEFSYNRSVTVLSINVQFVNVQFCNFSTHVPLLIFTPSRCVITGPPSHSIGASIVLRSVRLSSSVGVYNTPRRNVTHQGISRGGPVVLRTVRATPCCFSRLLSHDMRSPYPLTVPVRLFRKNEAGTLSALNRR